MYSHYPDLRPYHLSHQYIPPFVLQLWRKLPPQAPRVHTHPSVMQLCSRIQLVAPLACTRHLAI